MKLTLNTAFNKIAGTNVTSKFLTSYYDYICLVKLEFLKS